MKAKLTEHKGGFKIELTPETIAETVALGHCVTNALATVTSITLGRSKESQRDVARARRKGGKP